MTGIMAVAGVIVVAISDNVALGFLITAAGLQIGGVQLQVQKTNAVEEAVRVIAADVRRVDETLRRIEGTGATPIREDQVSAGIDRLEMELATIKDRVQGLSPRPDEVTSEVLVGPPGSTLGETSMGPTRVQIAERLLDYFDKHVNGSHDELVKAAAEGYVVLREEKHIRNVLRILTEGAREEILAVDHIWIENWSHHCLRQYLDLQLAIARVRGVRLQRIRVFDPSELFDPKRRAALLWFLEKHRQAGAELVLCPLTERLKRKLNRIFGGLIFFPATGCLIVDKERTPISLRGIVGENGYIHSAEVDLLQSPRARCLVTDYEKLLGHIHEIGLHDWAMSKLEGPERP